MGKFTAFHFHSEGESKGPIGPGMLLGKTMAGEPFGVMADMEAETAEVVESLAFHSDEAAARFYMNALWTEEKGPLFEVTAPERPELVPDLRLRTVRDSPQTETRLVHFNQSAKGVPVLGAHAVVELSPQRELVAIDAQIAEVPDVSPTASIAPTQAIAAVAKMAEVDPSVLAGVPAPRLRYYRDDNTWHLIYEVRQVPAAPPAFRKSVETEVGHGLGASPRAELVAMTYLVDAHSGGVILYYSEVPWLDIPTKCTGTDELQSDATFYGFDNAGAFEMRDPLRNMRTFDLAFADLATAPLPSSPVSHTAPHFATTNTAAVSAHVNAARVFDFFNDVFKRKGVDDNGMELVSVVNCTYRTPGAKKWKNAVWYKQRMWYGQVPNAAGGFDSYSRYLDVIAHELTHGVTETTSGLKYLNESGALNESFSDIFGIVVKNLAVSDVGAWDWELGSGLAASGGPLRNLRDPKQTGDPDHWNDYRTKSPSDDSGGVHTNSNIHNKAAYNVFTAADAQGQYVFVPKDVTMLYYLTLIRLSSFATFSDVLATMQNVIKSYWSGQPQVIQAATNAVVQAYGKVGIT